jgi:hypothetical protein
MRLRIELVLPINKCSIPEILFSIPVSGTVIFTFFFAGFFAR